MLRIHQPPAGEGCDAFFQVTIAGERAYPWFCRVSAMPYNTPWPGRQRPLDQTEEASFLSFEMDAPVEMTLLASRDFSECTVRPLSRGIQPRVQGREIRLEITRCGHYTVELDGWHHALHIFANPLTDFGVDKSAANVRYLAPGVHEGDLELRDGETLFLEGGAVLYGSVTAIHKKNVRIVGYGVIDGSREVRTDETPLLPWNLDGTEDLRDEATLRRHLSEKRVLKGCVRLYSCENCQVAGVITRDSATFSMIFADCARIDCEWAKTIGMWRYNSDGIDLFNSHHVRVANCFLRDFDDCVVLKAIKGWDAANVHHVTVTGCTVWCDWARCLEVGEETCADEYYDILWEDCDLIHGSFMFLEIRDGDRAWVHDMLVRNIRCECSPYDLPPVFQSDMNAPYPGFGKSYQPELIVSHVQDGPWSNDHILGKVTDVRFENIFVSCPADAPMPRSRLTGAAEGHGTSRLTIDGVFRNGTRLRPREIPLEKSEFDHDIQVK